MHRKSYESCESALHPLVWRIDTLPTNKEIAAFLEIELPFDHTSFKSIVTAARRDGAKDII